MSPLHLTVCDEFKQVHSRWYSPAYTSAKREQPYNQFDFFNQNNREYITIRTVNTGISELALLLVRQKQIAILYHTVLV